MITSFPFEETDLLVLDEVVPFSLLEEPFTEFENNMDLIKSPTTYASVPPPPVQSVEHDLSSFEQASNQGKKRRAPSNTTQQSHPKQRQQLSALQNEERVLESDLRCLIQSKRMRPAPSDADMDIFIELFEEAHEMLVVQEEYFADQYELLETIEAEVGKLRSQIKWIKLRLELKRRLLYVLLSGLPLDHISSQDYEHALEEMLFSSVLNQDCKVTAEKVQTQDFVSSGMSKTRATFTNESKEYLKQWFDSHMDHPYPTTEEKAEMAKHTGLQSSQISTWFTNERVRNWKRTNSTPSSPCSSVSSLDDAATFSSTWKSSKKTRFQ